MNLFTHIQLTHKPMYNMSDNTGPLTKAVVNLPENLSRQMHNHELKTFLRPDQGLIQLLEAVVSPVDETVSLCDEIYLLGLHLQ